MVTIHRMLTDAADMIGDLEDNDSYDLYHAIHAVEDAIYHLEEWEESMEETE